MGSEFVVKDFSVPIIQTEPPPTLTLYSPDGREAIIDFGGDAVTYSGELPVDESAKIFFACVFSYFGR